MEIMKLIPTGKDYLWGGTRLREEYGKQIDLTPLAETWECSVHPDGPSYVANGIYKGQTLAEVLSAHPEYLGTKVENGELPVLVKFIDAKKDLSVQVHPDDAYAREHEGDNGKTEMWYVVDADEGAHLIYGFQHKVTEEILRKAVETGTLDVYRNAQVFVFPSVYEGFGVPPIEAMSMGVPVISSDAASLPEVLGQAAIYFENNSINDLKDKILLVLSMKEDAISEIKKAGIEQSKKFSWKKEAIKLKNILFK